MHKEKDNGVLLVVDKQKNKVKVVRGLECKKLIPHKKQRIIERSISTELLKNTELKSILYGFNLIMDKLLKENT